MSIPESPFNIVLPSVVFGKCIPGVVELAEKGNLDGALELVGELIKILHDLGFTKPVNTSIGVASIGANCSREVKKLAEPTLWMLVSGLMIVWGEPDTKYSVVVRGFSDQCSAVIFCPIEPAATTKRSKIVIEGVRDNAHIVVLGNGYDIMPYDEDTQYHICEQSNCTVVTPVAAPVPE
jgi:hypothetical protein